MEKELLRKKQLEQMDADKKAEEEKKFEEAKKKHAKHPDVHHPVSIPFIEFEFCCNVWKKYYGSQYKDWGLAVCFVLLYSVFVCFISFYVMCV